MTELESLPNWQRLDRVSQIFLKTLVDSGAYYPEEYLSFLLLSHKELKGRIEHTVSALEDYAVTPETAMHPKVKKGWDVLKDFIQDKEAVLHNYGISLFITGSMRYDDPVNLDIDGLFITEGDSDNVRRQVWQWSRWFEEAWVDIGIGESDLTYRSIEQFSSHCARIASGDLAYVTNYGVDIDLELGHASDVLTGYPIYTPNPEVVGKLQSEVCHLYRATPLMAAVMYRDLAECLRIRQDRRSRRFWLFKKGILFSLLVK